MVSLERERTLGVSGNKDQAPCGVAILFVPQRNLSIRKMCVNRQYA